MAGTQKERQFITVGDRMFEVVKDQGIPQNKGTLYDVYKQPSITKQEIYEEWKKLLLGFFQKVRNNKVFNVCNRCK